MEDRVKLKISSISNFIDSSGEMAMVWARYLFVVDACKAGLLRGFRQNELLIISPSHEGNTDFLRG